VPIPVLRVSQLNRYVRSLLESTPQLAEVYLSGEISNLSYYPVSGTFYFSLKDETASVKAVLFRQNASFLRFLPENGMHVLARGAVTLYERDGAFQIVVSELVPKGEGERAAAVSQLRRKLEAEGLFDPARKRRLPEKVAVIGVVTSPQGAVLHDIVSVTDRKAPDVQVLLSPATVQGDGASASVLAALKRLWQDGRSDLIILARGGGSTEDLWGFQEETVVRAVASSPIPIISAIGHETDTTLCDWVADCRAATPTAAAEIALGSRPDLAVRISQAALAMQNAYARCLTDKSAEVAKRKLQIVALKPDSILALKREKLYNNSKLMHDVGNTIISRRKRELALRAERLDLVSPLRVLSRGYSITEQAGKPLLSADRITVGDTITTQLSDGRITSVVTEVSK
jgi:exodeoxyribonuclease VII large subunit